MSFDIPTNVASLLALRPGAQWTMEGNDLSTLNWLDSSERPTDDEIRAHVIPPPVPQTISDRQFFQQLAVRGVISQDEALASCAAVIPAPLLALIEQLPPDQKFAAKMLVSGATVFERNHPMTIAIGTAYGWGSAEIDAFFVASAEL